VAALPKAEDKPSLVLKIVLVTIGKVIAEIGQKVVEFGRPECDKVGDRDVYTTTERHREGVPCRTGREAAVPCDLLAYLLECVAIDIGVGAAEQEVSERMEPMGSEFNFRTKHVGKQVALD